MQFGLLGNFEDPAASTGEMCKHSTAAARGGSGQALRQSKEPERTSILATNRKGQALLSPRNAVWRACTPYSPKFTGFKVPTVHTVNTKNRKSKATAAMGTVQRQDGRRRREDEWARASGPQCTGAGVGR